MLIYALVQIQFAKLFLGEVRHGLSPITPCPCRAVFQDNST